MAGWASNHATWLATNFAGTADNSALSVTQCTTVLTLLSFAICTCTGSVSTAVEVVDEAVAPDESLS